jgi:signal transduction histidine kinase
MTAPGPAAADGAAARSPRRWWTRLWPRTLFGQLLLVLTAGLLVAQLLSAAINVAERERLVSGSYGQQGAQRMADVVRLLDSLGEPERQALVAVLRAPPLVLSLQATASLRDADEAGAASWQAQGFAVRLQAALGDDRPLHVLAIEPVDRGARRGDDDAMRGMADRPGLRRGGMHGSGHGPAAAWGGAARLQVEVRLQDGRWARFDSRLPEAPQALPWRLALTLAVLLASVLALSYGAVRWVVRPLQRLTDAAQALGQDLHSPPLAETGPVEVQRAARAFNTMQQRLAAFVDERTRMLTALSHDLKTPLTRMRLRADLMDDEDQRQRFEADLKEMEAMVTQTLDFMRGLGGHEPSQPLDLMVLLTALQRDHQAMGRTVAVDGPAQLPVQAVPSLLRRALNNLIDNAVLYGERATVRVEQTATHVLLHIEDAGPGVPGSELERVFEPFHRLEASRNRATGGTGLGLGIARNVARLHGGDVVLHNRPEGGLDAVLSLLREPTAAV